MMRFAAPVIATLLGASAGCGDNVPGPPCERPYASYSRVVGCQSALWLAQRYSDEILLQQAEWDEYFRINAAVYRAEPLTKLAQAFPVSGWGGRVSIYTRFPPIIEAWSQGRIRTGDASVDAIFADTAERVEQLPFASELKVFRVHFPGPISVDALVRRLEAAAIPDTTGPEIYRGFPDITVTWTGEVAHLDLTGGWGDCFSSCLWLHYWSASVDQNGIAEVQDLGGDPIPDWLAESLRNGPMPPP